MGPTLVKAFEFAAKIHAGQTRKGKDVPYISHVMAVSSLVMECGGSEKAAVAAILHDVVEDSEGKVHITDLEKNFGKDVASMVDALTDAKSFPKGPWKKRKDLYLSQLESASDEVKLIAACDKWHNLNCLLKDLDDEGEEAWERFSSRPDQQLWYYQSVLERVQEVIPLWMAEELEDGIEMLQQYLEEE